MKSSEAILGAFILFFIILVGVQYGISAIGTTADGVNMTGNAYEDEYNAATNTSILGIGLVGEAPMFIGLLILILAIVGLMKYKT